MANSRQIYYYNFDLQLIEIRTSFTLNDYVPVSILIFSTNIKIFLNRAKFKNLESKMFK